MASVHDYSQFRAFATYATSAARLSAHGDACGAPTATDPLERRASYPTCDHGGDSDSIDMSHAGNSSTDSIQDLFYDCESRPRPFDQGLPFVRSSSLFSTANSFDGLPRQPTPSDYTNDLSSRDGTDMWTSQSPDSVSSVYVSVDDHSAPPGHSPASAIPNSAPEPAPALVLTPQYQALAEPLSGWVAEYIWKVMTVGARYSMPPPESLATSIRAVLWSTLLQPGAILLAFYYLQKLPVAYLGPDEVVGTAAQRYRDIVFGDDIAVNQQSPFNADAPFKVFLSIVMLANKQLDDHCFSCRTWHDISGVAIGDLSTMEYCALDMLSHSLWIPSQLEWTRWLHIMKRYHESVQALAGPEPIGSPMKPHGLLMRTIDDLISASAELITSETIEPVFIDLAECLGEQTVKRSEPDELQVDLDADGPLPEEYIPRRISTLFPTSLQSQGVRQAKQRVLPPPAKWSPAADPPIHRERTRPYIPAQRNASIATLSAIVGSRISFPGHSASLSVSSSVIAKPLGSSLHQTSWVSNVRDRSASVGQHSHAASFSHLPSLSAIRATIQSHQSAFVRPHWLKA